MLWWEMKQVTGSDVYMHFWRQFRSKWARVLRFLPPTDHSACDDCVAYKELFAEARDDATRLDLARGYKAHLDHIREDRALEEYLQKLGPLNAPQGQGSCMMIHIDGMDQAKWAIPRQKKALVAKSLSGFQKPRFKVEGVWVHNALLALWIVDSRVPSDSSMVIETLSRSIQLVATECERRGKDFPQQLCVWADNCVREAKNAMVIKFLSMLLTQTPLNLTSLLFSKRGHTHTMPLDTWYNNGKPVDTEWQGLHDVIMMLHALVCF
ncbi:unnamed protein product [Durusdinium trenchii]|uniref:DUF7869 domain-containing protein n=1 Tax=Durusdinium trenchii TaxID=1381693 RepID=A0ABP0J648_9DINO